MLEHALERIDWSGKTPFEIQSMRVQPDGFQLNFTTPVDAKSAEDISNYYMETFTHHFYEAYGGPEIEHREQKITAAKVSEDGLSVRLTVDKLIKGHIHELHLPGLLDRNNQPLLHDVAYYTLNQIPEK